MSSAWIAAFVVTWVVFLAMATIVLGMLKRTASVLERAEALLVSQGGLGGVTVGSVIRPFEACESDGTPVDSSDLIKIPTIVLFLEPGCGTCRQLVEQLDGVGDAIDGVPLVVVMDDTTAGHAYPFPAGLRVIYQPDGVVSRVFENIATPQAFVVDVGGFVMDRRAANSLAELRMMAWWQREGGDAGHLFTAAASAGMLGK